MWIGSSICVFKKVHHMRGVKHFSEFPISEVWEYPTVAKVVDMSMVSTRNHVT